MTNARITAAALQRLANLRYSRFITADEVSLARVVESFAAEALEEAGIARRVPTNKPTPDAGHGDWERRREAMRGEVFEYEPR